MESSDDIYKLGLYGQTFIKALNKNVSRVPGGWLFEDWDDSLGRTYNPVFIPFDNEFQHLFIPVGDK